MNYLSHFVYNHQIGDLPRDPCFAVGVALPDLWSRFSRRRRLKWRAVRAATPESPSEAALRAGLLNHAAVDRRFHALPCFNQWLQTLKRPWLGGATHSVVVDFLAHVAIEITLDQHLLRRDPALVDHFYDTIATADATRIAEDAGRLGQVDTAGLDGTLTAFVQRRYLHAYRSAAGLEHTLQLAVSLTAIRTPPPAEIGRDILRRAVDRVDPETVWHEMGSLD